MRTIFYPPNAVLGILLCSSLVATAQSPKGFGQKEHKDTLLPKSGFPIAQVVNGKAQSHFLFNPPFGSIQQPVGSALAAKPSANARVENSIEVVTSKESGLPIFISSPKKVNNARTESTDKTTSCFAYLDELSGITKISKANEQFQIKSTLVDALGKSHVKLNQFYKGIKIDGAEVVVHLNASGEGEALNGRYHLISKEIDTKPILNSSEALEKAITDVSKKTVYKELTSTQKALLHETGPSIETVIFEQKELIHSFYLAYKIVLMANLLEEWTYFVDAKNGNILESYKNSCHAGPATSSATDLNGVNRAINTYLDGASYTLVDATKSMYNASTNDGIIITLDAGNTNSTNFQYSEIKTSNNVWNNPTAVSAHYNAGIAFDYYKYVHGRNSIDGNGGNIISFINVADDDGSSMDNAYWNGKAMFYGNGNTGFKPLAGGLDVAGHEMTHGVVQNTAALKYQGESGAINESMADVFGALMDSTNWLIGENVVKTSAFPSGALRSLSDPHNGGSGLNDPGYQPRIKSEKYNGSQDNGGVHINSGIPNWAFYKLASVIGRYKSSKIYYRALSLYLTQSSQFIDLRLAIIKAAEDLFGTGSNERKQAISAFDAVGITDGTGGTYTSTLPTNPGTEYMLAFSTDVSDPNGIYRIPINGDSPEALTNRQVYHKPSVTDDGTAALMVGNDKKIYGIDLSATPVTVESLVNSTIWANAAISKDGKRMAAVTLDQDTSIYVYDFATSKAVRYMLYNPTYTEGVKAAGPVYADAIEWDYTGEYLVYDCFNSLKGSGTENIEYWDINFIKVWDNASNDFGDGNIFKLFSNLDAGESIGNPTFSKNSPSIIAFDYFNEQENVYAIFGLDIEKNEFNGLAVNNSLGWPSFNKTDDRVAFTSGANEDEINMVQLNPDKISPSTDPVNLFTDAKWPVYYTFGNRNFTPTGLEELDLKTEPVRAFPNPTTGFISLRLPQISGELVVEIYNSIGAKVDIQKIQASQPQVDLSRFTDGLYTLSLKSGKATQQLKVLKQ